MYNFERLHRKSSKRMVVQLTLLICWQRRAEVPVAAANMSLQAHTVVANTCDVPASEVVHVCSNQLQHAVLVACYRRNGLSHQ